MTYSLDFRRKVLLVLERDGLTASEVARRFDIGRTSVFRWLKTLSPLKSRNSPSRKLDMELLKQDVEEHPDSYQYERAERFGVSQRCIWGALRRLGVSYKKNSKTPKVRRRRQAYLPKQNKEV